MDFHTPCDKLMISQAKRPLAATHAASTLQIKQTINCSSRPLEGLLHTYCICCGITLGRASNPYRHQHIRSTLAPLLAAILAILLLSRLVIGRWLLDKAST